MKKTLAELKQDILFNVTLRGRPFIFAATWGLFSPEKIDDGSYLLIENAKIGPNDRVQGKFDVIVSNLPAKVSKEMYWILFEEAHEHLNTGGFSMLL